MSKLTAGHSGEDSMRKQAERMIGGEFRPLPPEQRDSASARSRDKMRPYKKGGHIHPLTKEQTDLHIPNRMKGKKLNVETMAEAMRMKKGGRCMNEGGAMNEGGPMKKGGKCKMADGGGAPMNGEKGAKKAINFNYEKDMKGERGRAPKTIAKGASEWGAGANPLKKGGAAKKRKHADGGAYAAGGVAKLRKGVMAPNGKPSTRRVKAGF